MCRKSIKKVGLSFSFPANSLFLCLLICYNREEEKRRKKIIRKILLVKTMNYRQQVKQLLEQWGYEVVAVGGLYGCPQDLRRK